MSHLIIRLQEQNVCLELLSLHFLGVPWGRRGPSPNPQGRAGDVRGGRAGGARGGWAHLLHKHIVFL